MDRCQAMDSWDSADSGVRDACDDAPDWRDVERFEAAAVRAGLNGKVDVTLDSTSNCSLFL